jgi:hypothetical protein
VGDRRGGGGVLRGLHRWVSHLPVVVHEGVRDSARPHPGSSPFRSRLPHASVYGPEQPVPALAWRYRTRKALPILTSLIERADHKLRQRRLYGGNLRHLWECEQVFVWQQAGLRSRPFPCPSPGISGGTATASLPGSRHPLGICSSCDSPSGSVPRPMREPASGHHGGVSEGGGRTGYATSVGEAMVAASGEPCGCRWWSRSMV